MRTLPGGFLTASLLCESADFPSYAGASSRFLAVLVYRRALLYLDAFIEFVAKRLVFGENVQAETRD